MSTPARGARPQGEHARKREHAFMWFSKEAQVAHGGSADLRRARSNGPWAPGPALWGGPGPGPKGPSWPQNTWNICGKAPRSIAFHLRFSFFLREPMG